MWQLSFRACRRSENFYSHTSCEVWHKLSQLYYYTFEISTHTPLARCDLGGFAKCVRINIISTHTPLARCDFFSIALVELAKVWFLLTHLLRGVTNGLSDSFEAFYHFYSHTSCEVWQRRWNLMNFDTNFYSHTSCEVWHSCLSSLLYLQQFLLTHLLRGVTQDLYMKMKNIPFLLTHLLRGVTGIS